MHWRMKNFKSLSNHELLIETKKNVAEERKYTALVLESLQEIELRRLHAQRGYESMHSFCVKELGYSDGAAHRRIEAMRLMTSVPEAQSSIESGKLSLSTAAMLQTFFKNE